MGVHVVERVAHKLLRSGEAPSVEVGDEGVESEFVAEERPRQVEESGFERCQKLLEGENVRRGGEGVRV